MMLHMMRLQVRTWELKIYLACPLHVVVDRSQASNAGVLSFDLYRGNMIMGMSRRLPAALSYLDSSRLLVRGSKQPDQRADQKWVTLAVGEPCAGRITTWRTWLLHPNQL